jgi:carbon monoxide dehydrogenase subunit G
MARVEKSVEVNCPVRTVYNQWTQFEDFPRFMEGVEEVRQLDETHLHWRAKIGGKEKEWDAEIVEQVPDRRIAWRSTGGAPNAGTVEFEPEGSDRTRVKLAMDYEPEGAVEKVGDAVGVPSRRIEEDLERFKQFIESRGSETGQWRGEVRGGKPTGSSGSGSSGSSGGSVGGMGAGGAGTGASAATEGGSPAAGANVGADGTGRGTTGVATGASGSTSIGAATGVPGGVNPGGTNK